MGFTVFAEKREEFDRWLHAQRSAPGAPSTEDARRGQQIFQRSACPMCHAVQGTQAFATAGPDLSHLASRQTIAAGTLPNSVGNLAGWILDPQSQKPGALMPPQNLAQKDLQDLLAYLETLK